MYRSQYQSSLELTNATSPRRYVYSTYLNNCTVSELLVKENVIIKVHCVLYI